MSEPTPVVTPRWVPLSVPLTGLLRWDWRESYVVLLAFVVPGVVLARSPVLFSALAIGLLCLGTAVRIGQVYRWWTLLRHGHVVAAESVRTEIAGSGTARLSHATGWRVQRGWYTGEITDSVVAYSVGEQQRALVVRGLPYTSGVLVAHPSRPEALCVSAFPFDIALDDGWSASVPRQFWGGAAATAALYGGLAAAAVIYARHTWF
jgi:hypothetical protein